MALELLRRSRHDAGMHASTAITALHRDGKTTVVTPISELDESDRSLYLDHLIALGGDDRYLRFGSPISDDGIFRYVAGIDFARDAVFAVYDPDMTIAAAGHFAPMPLGTTPAELALGRCAEFGLSVAERARRRGLGTALFLRAAGHARNLRVQSLFMHCLAENRAMIRIARRAGMEIRQRHGEADAYLALPPGTVASAIEEGVQRQIARLDVAIKRDRLLHTASNIFAPTGDEY
jgi:RimJ/RimL family protein N-acetyltransferase